MAHAYDFKIKYSTLMKIALPTVFNYTFFSFYTNVDGIFVANLVGTNALSAVNIVFPFLLIVIGLGTMMGAGGSALISKKMGEGSYDEAREDMTLILVSGVVLSIIIMILGFLNLNRLLGILGANSEIMDTCRAYAIPLYLSMPMVVIGMILDLFFMAEGRPKLALLASLMGGITNIVLDYVFIAIFDMGVAGAAIATGLGYSFPAIYGLIFFLKNKEGNLYFVGFRFMPRVVIKACSNGLAQMVSIMSNALVMVLYNNLMMSLAGINGVAAVTIILYSQMLLTSAFTGYSTGVAPMISYNYGKGDNENLERIHKLSLETIAVGSIVIISICYLFSKQIVMIFARGSADVLIMALGGFPIYAVAFFFIGFNIYAATMFTAFNDGRISATISFCRTFVFLIGALMTLPRLFGVVGVWASLPTAEALCILVTLYMLHTRKSKYGYAG